jgi:hypothetical protein
MCSGEYDVSGVNRTVGSIPTVARHCFRTCLVWIYTDSNTRKIIVKVYLVILDYMKATHLQLCGEGRKEAPFACCRDF